VRKFADAQAKLYDEGGRFAGAEAKFFCVGRKFALNSLLCVFVPLWLEMLETGTTGGGERERRA
jgi:hypothetical protein